jgi:glycosyltransferase involved in cell wall biosynthesis
VIRIGSGSSRALPTAWADGRGRRVLFLYSTLTVGGAERQLSLLVPGLRQRGFDPIVATLRHEGRHFEELRAAGVATVFLAMRSRMDVAGATRAYRLWKLQPDIVFSCSLDAQVIGQVVARRAGAYHVTAEHGGAGIQRAPHRAALSRLIAPRVDLVIAVSGSQTPELVSLGYPVERISVIPNGIPPPEPSRPPALVRAELGLSNDEVVALFVATLRPEKRVDAFIRAVVHARTREPRLRGVIAGGGPELARARALAEASRGAVRVLGERTDVPALIEAADVVCLSSSFEGLPMIVLEAMALGRPVIAPAVGGIPEAVVSERTGLLVAPGDDDAFSDALVELAGAAEMRRRMGAEALRVYRERYTLELMVSRYSEVLAGAPISRVGVSS